METRMVVQPVFRKKISLKQIEIKDDVENPKKNRFLLQEKYLKNICDYQNEFVFICSNNFYLRIFARLPLLPLVHSYGTQQFGYDYLSYSSLFKIFGSFMIEEELKGESAMRGGVCSCIEYEIGDSGNLSTYCSHVPVIHMELKVLKPSNITEYPRQENNSLEEMILNGVEVNPNPQFDASLTSEYTLADYLQGKATQSRIHYYRKLFISELSVYLNQNNYLVSKNRAEQKWGYKALEKAILTAYPNVHQDEGVKASYKRTGPLKWVISHLADRRRKQVTRKDGKVFVCETTSVDEAYNLLQTLPSKLWQCTQLKKALFITKDLRCRLLAEETLPDYLLVDSIICKSARECYIS
ncbi:hypothetical protein Anas_10718 [Armadillidium nasatum]|uniref:SWIM-type domain-containing protein n=1 Tax=Armadillidium nasatum TaxID=96803 RepID=A0A5N5SS34_9CRUS|nr:hypothetical protein Anas_10718 [Armadillidium nasatum]